MLGCYFNPWKILDPNKEQEMWFEINNQLGYKEGAD